MSGMLENKKMEKMETETSTQKIKKTRKRWLNTRDEYEFLRMIFSLFLADFIDN